MLRLRDLTHLRLVVLDRDGVLVEWHHHAHRNEDINVISSAVKAVFELSRRNVSIHVISNQSVVGRGKIQIEELKSINRRVERVFAEGGGDITSWQMCPHLPDDGCLCRKPSPVAVTRLIEEYGVTTPEVLVVGDGISDFDLAKNAGVPFACIRSPITPLEVMSTSDTFPDLYSLVKFLIDGGKLQA